MINYNNNDLEIYPLFSNILKNVLKVDTVEDQEVWEEARGYLNPPNFENILLELTRDKILSSLYGKLEEEMTDEQFENFENSFKIQFNIDGRASSLSINGDDIYTSSDFKMAVNINGGQL